MVLYPYTRLLKLDSKDRVFDYLIGTMKRTIRGWNYFVNWAKIFGNIQDIERPLHLLNSLIGKENIEEEFRDLLKHYPEVGGVIPILIACRENSLTILNSDDYRVFNYNSFNFSSREVLSAEEIRNITEFATKVGLLSILRDRNIRNIVDYVIGIEVGLDTNARKNRSGKVMESLVNKFIEAICRENNWRYVDQATAEKIKIHLGYNIKVDKTSRTFDFAIDNSRKLFLIETNYYSGGGSKLKATAGEYKAVYDFVKASNAENEFIWITDGMGWKTTKNALRETFEHIDYILNLDMVEKGLLFEILSGTGYLSSQLAAEESPS